MAEKRNSHRDIGDLFRYKHSVSDSLWRLCMKDGEDVVLKCVKGVNDRGVPIHSYNFFDTQMEYVPKTEKKTVYTSVWSQPTLVWSFSHLNKVAYDKTKEYYLNQKYTLLSEFTNEYEVEMK